MAKVILLNGSSSAGKTTLATYLQQLLPEPYQHIGLDQFRDGMPMRVRGLNAPIGSEGARGLNVVPGTLEGQPVTHIEFGDYGEKVLGLMRKTVAAFAVAGIPVIVDDLLFKTAYLRDYARTLDTAQTWLIGVRCDLADVKTREANRLGRFPGTAIAHYDTVHDHGVTYDAEVNTSLLSPRAAALEIIEALARPPRALRQAPP